MAGFRELLAVEWDQNACDTFRLNFPDVPVWQGDIGKLSVEEVLEITGSQPGGLDVLDGSPPCQGFSTAGKRNMDDDRNQLFREYVRLLRGLQPRVFVMENVSGMVKGKMKLIFAEVLRELKASGYRVSARLIDAAYFNVPQHRQRIIFVGVRDGLGDPSHPSAYSAPVTFREACSDVSSGDAEERPTGDIVRAYARLHTGTWSTNPRIYRSVKGNLGSSLSLKWASWDSPCGTIIKDERAFTGVVHPDHKRYLSLSEMKRVTSFPDAFAFTDRKNGLLRIGNSVPPLFMKAIAEHIRTELL